MDLHEQNVTSEGVTKGGVIMETLQPILEQHPFFDGFTSEYMQLIAGCASNVRFASNEVIFREFEPADKFYMIRVGKVALETLAAQQGKITIETIEPGEVLGWSWLFEPYLWHFSARALEPTRAIVLDGKCLRGKGEENHDFGYELMKRISQILIHRLQATRLKELDFYGPSPLRGRKWR